MTTPVSFELAKLLKEKGFDEPCIRFYNGKFICYKISDDDGIEPPYVDTSKDIGLCLNAPTIAEVITWLYEKHGIWIFILPQDKSVVDYRVESSDYPSLPLFLCIVKYEKDLSMKEVLNSSDTNSKMFLHFDEPVGAYLSAIEYSLKNLI